MRIFYLFLISFFMMLNVYGSSVKIEDESGRGVCKNEDDSHASTDPGIMILTVRGDTRASLGDAGDYVPLKTDDAGNLYTNDTNTSGMLTALQLIDDTVYIDDADWSTESSKHLLIGGIYQSSPQSITDGDTGPLQLDINGKIIESNSSSIKTAAELINEQSPVKRLYRI